MSLPDCIDIGGEERSEGGFCPVDYYIPKYYFYLFDNNNIKHTVEIYENSSDEENDINAEWIYETYGFVSGCHWGGSYEIYSMDLTDAHKGIIKRKEYIGQLPNNVIRLKNLFNINDKNFIEISTANFYSFEDDGSLTKN
jgi:hypothetical protein